MTTATAELLVLALGIYAAIGLVFAIAFTAVGAGRVDPVARGGTWGFRILIVPGAAALWPLLAARWLRGQGVPPNERNPHREAARKAVGS